MGCCSINKSRETERYRLCCCLRALRIILYLRDGYWHYTTADRLIDAVWFGLAVYSFVLLCIITSNLLPLDRSPCLRFTFLFMISFPASLWKRVGATGCKKMEQLGRGDTSSTRLDMLTLYAAFALFFVLSTLLSVITATTVLKRVSRAPFALVCIAECSQYLMLMPVRRAKQCNTTSGCVLGLSCDGGRSQSAFHTTSRKSMGQVFLLSPYGLERVFVSRTFT